MTLATGLEHAGTVIGALAIALMVTEIVLLVRGHPRPAMVAVSDALFVISNTLWGIASVLQHQWGQAAFSFAFAAFFAWYLWRWWRKRRRPVAALLGAKSKALRDALVRKQRELTRPRPVLRPVPQGGMR